MPTAILTFKSATRDSITFGHDGEGWLIPSDTAPSSIQWSEWTNGDLIQTRSGHRTYISYSTENGCTTIWRWTFSGGNGGSSSKKASHSKTISGFTSGAQNSLTGTLTASRTSQNMRINCTQKRTRTKIPGKPAEGDKPAVPDRYTDWVYENIQEGRPLKTGAGASKGLGTARDTITFYTQPEQFNWNSGVASGQTIQTHNGLTALKWNELVNKLAAYNNWKQQKSVGSAGQTVSPGDLVSANVYNSVARELGCSTVTGGREGTVIKASYFIALQTAINK